MALINRAPAHPPSPATSKLEGRTPSTSRCPTVNRNNDDGNGGLGMDGFIFPGRIHVYMYIWYIYLPFWMDFFIGQLVVINIPYMTWILSFFLGGG